MLSVSPGYKLLFIMKYTNFGLAFDDALSSKGWSSALKLTQLRNLADVRFGTAESSIGPLTVFWAEDGLRYLGMDEEISLGKVARAWPHMNLIRDDKGAARLVKQIESVWVGEAADTITMAVEGTPFQMDVWRALMRIPLGHVVSYGTVAAAVGRPLAVRAVGSAVGSNPVTLLIPCHRVIQQNGSVKNYGWGDAMKQRLLKMESNLAAA